MHSGWGLGNSAEMNGRHIISFHPSYNKRGFIGYIFLPPKGTHGLGRVSCGRQKYAVVLPWDTPGDGGVFGASQRYRPGHLPKDSSRLTYREIPFGTEKESESSPIFGFPPDPLPRPTREAVTHLTRGPGGNAANAGKTAWDSEGFVAITPHSAMLRGRA